MNKIEFFPVFCIECYTYGYGTHKVYIGAENKQALIEFFESLNEDSEVVYKENNGEPYYETHNKLADFLGEDWIDKEEAEKRFLNRLKDESISKEYGYCEVVSDTYTTTPYKVLSTSFYIE